MKIKSANTGNIYTITLRNQSGEERIACPECSGGRKKTNAKDLAWDHAGERGYCHHCNSAFFKFKSEKGEKNYYVPEWKNNTGLTDKAAHWFEGRMIKQSILVEMKIYSDKAKMPQYGKDVEVMCFPYFRDGQLVNTKYRGPNKSFKMVTGAELIFWNIDAITDCDEVIITEGEIDALCFIQVGMKNCISVPNGANTKTMEYLDSSIDLIASKDKIYLATDNDLKGIALRNEIARRIGYEKCYVVNLRECKDANEYLQKYTSEFINILKDAKLIQIRGISVPDTLYSETKEYYNLGVQKGLVIDIPEIDEHITWETGRLCMVTGIPSHGKSSFVDYLCLKLNQIYGWKMAMFTPENYPLKYHIARLLELVIGCRFGRFTMTEQQFDKGFEYLNDNVRYILNEEDFSLKTIMDLAKYLVKSFGIKILVIDPYNKVEHKFEKWESETQYIGRLLDELINFAKYYQVLVFLVAHPKKMDSAGDSFNIPTLYDISGSAHFYNKTDYGITIYREKDFEHSKLSDEITVYFQKIKYKNLGKTGNLKMRYDQESGRFYIEGKKDSCNWLEKEANQQEIWTEQDNNQIPF